MNFLNMMSGVLVNTATVLIGSTIGLLLKKGIPEKISKTVMLALGLCTIYIGISGSLEGENTIVLIISMVIGTIIGCLIDLDDKINRLGGLIERKVKHKDGQTSIAEGFMTASILFCVGAMTIVGALDAGLTGDNKLYYTKAVMDMISSCMLASTLGLGVFFAGFFVLIFQGALVLLAGLLQGLLSNTAMVAEMTCCGSVIIIGLGLNLLGITKLKVANFLPAIFLAPLAYILVQYLPI